MTDFGRWERFDADEAEIEVERQAEAHETIRERISLERRVLKKCEERAATLKSEAAVRSLKAKRGMRRRGAGCRACHASSITNPGVPRADADTSTVCETPTNGTAVDSSGEVCRAQASADQAGAIVTGLRKGLGLRDVVLASAEAGELYKGVTKARECLSELGAVQDLLRATSPAVCDRGRPPLVATDNSDRFGGGGGGGGLSHSVSARGHDHSHAHSHPCSTGLARSNLGHYADSSETRGVHPVASSASDPGRSGGDNGEKSSDDSDRNALKAKGGALSDAVEVVRRAKVAVRMAEGACLLRVGRAAQATEAFRDLLLENPTSVQAWTMRGRAFLSMQNHLLAGLHFDRALELDPKCADAAELKKSLRFSPETARTERGVSEAVESPLLSSKSLLDHEVRLGKRQGGVEGAASFVVEGGESKAEAHDGEQLGAQKEEAFRRSLATACEEYRAGVVFHQEAFYASSRNKFCRALSLIDEAEEDAQVTAQGGEGGGEVGSQNDEGVRVPESTGSEAGCASVTGRAPIEDLKKILDEVRVGCHLNIAAAALLRKADYESVVHHCTRAIEIQPSSSSRALVRRAQAHEELGRFLLCIDDLEAAEASLLGDAREIHSRGEIEEPEMALAGELVEIRKRLERARWMKIHVGNDKDELPGVGGSSG